jgi:hypothetical protein
VKSRHICVSHVLALTMISNLDQIWPGGDMGNFETVLPGYGYGFMFGTGADPYALNTVTIEELGGPGTVQLGIYTVQNPLAGNNPTLIYAGALGNAVVDSRPTQWPTYTSFIDYTPVNSITLAPNTYYLISATEPVNGDDDTALTFNFNYSYNVAADWSVDQDVPSPWTYLGSRPPPSMSGWEPDNSPGSLMVEVDATPVPEPVSFTLLVFGSAIIGAGRYFASSSHSLCSIRTRLFERLERNTYAV